MGVDRRQLTLDYVCLNHLGWVRGASVGGNDVWPELLGAIVADEAVSSNAIVYSRNASFS